MRHISYKLSNLTLPVDWEARAARARTEVDMADPAERSDIINKYQDLWKALKSELMKLSHGKCWYTEARQEGTDVDVDHFRPKNSVYGVHRGTNHEKHPGYWWRAFDPRNFRLSCIVANRPRRDIETGHLGGKADRFPLRDEAKRAWCPKDDCDSEQPLLLDPCDPVDVTLVTFSENGEAVARYSLSDREWFHERAAMSIDLYHLNHHTFVKGRLDMRDRIRDLIEDARRYFHQLDGTNPEIERAYKRTIQLLREMRSPAAPYSVFAESIMEPYKYDESLRGVFQA